MLRKGRSPVAWRAAEKRLNDRPRIIPPIIALIPFFFLAGCNQDRASVADTFPKGSYASPWVLQGSIWSGSLEQAAGGLGEEAEQWARFAPDRVWLAIYRHHARPDHKLTVRAWAFASTDQARRAFEHFRPASPDQLKAGDEGCWTSDGILVRWGRLVFDIFGGGPTAIARPEQAVYLLAFIEKRMPADLPDAPQ